MGRIGWSEVYMGRREVGSKLGLRRTVEHREAESRTGILREGSPCEGSDKRLNVGSLLQGFSPEQSLASW